MIPVADPSAQYQSHRAEIDMAIASVLHRGTYVLGDEVRAFEAEFAAFIGVKHAVGVGSGTDALHLALVACGIGRGDEVITVSHTAVATVAAIEMSGATPVLADIDPERYTMDPETLAGLVTSRTKAIVPVHLYGQPADIVTIVEFARAHGLRVIEDCAQSPGATFNDKRTGAWGDLGCFSFYPTKNLGALGDGGMVVTNDDKLATSLRGLREYGWDKTRSSQVAGRNSRLDELQAAILRVKLRALDVDNARRAHLAARYDQAFAGSAVSAPKRLEGARHVYHLYVVRCGGRDAVRAELARLGIGSGIHYPLPVHLQPAYLGRLPGADRLGHTAGVVGEILSLPMFPELGEEQVATVAEALVETTSKRIPAPVKRGSR